ncbi:recombinase family protein [Bacteroides thetaiotaomicron]|nr:recombinase family protein [Bacteroides thetaiotaomicron]
MENGWGVEENHIYMDIMSGFKKGETRPQYSMMLEEVEQGNIGLILFSEFSRLARNATDLLESINYFREKGVYLYFQKQYLQPIITQYFIDNKSEIWLLFLIAHSKR